MNRQFRPQRKFIPEVAEARRLVASMGAKVQFRHVYRDHNALPDWLANVSRHLTTTIDITPHLHSCHPTITLFSPPPWKAREAEWQLATGNCAQGDSGGLVGLMARTLAGEWGTLQGCQVCGGRCHWGVDRQCWGCACWLHGQCVGGFEGESVGPYHCPSCLSMYTKQGVYDITLDGNVMSWVCVGSCPG